MIPRMWDYRPSCQLPTGLSSHHCPWRRPSRASRRYLR